MQLFFFCGINNKKEKLNDFKEKINNYYERLNSIKEENHNCTGEDCPVCACIHQAEQTLRNLGTGNIGNAVVSTLPVWNGILLPVCLFCVYTTSLVSQKVRLND